MSARSVFVVAGVGNGSGTGASAARVFSKAGYRVALIARNAEHLKNTAEQIKQTGGEAAAFPVPAYNHDNFKSAFALIKEHWPGSPVRVALFNAGHGVWKPFLDTTEADLRASLDTNVVAGFGFAREAVLAFRDQELNELGKRGTLVFTGATAATRGNTSTSALSASKFGLRALSQSLAKEFGKDNIHVAHAIIDGGILTDQARALRNNTEWEADENLRLNPESIAKTYLALANQDRSAMTWELDLRPAHEKW